MWYVWEKKIIMKRSVYDLEEFRYQGHEKRRKVKEAFDTCDAEFYKPLLSGLTNPTAIYLRDHVLNWDAPNPFGLTFEKTLSPKSVGYWRLVEKNKYPYDLQCVQIGEFYEFIGVDVIFTVEYGGMRAMGSTPTLKSGTPLASIQRLLDALVQQGFRIRVYEEIGDSQEHKNQKARVLRQVVSPSNPLFFRVINSMEEEDMRQNLPVIFVLEEQVMIFNVVDATYQLHKQMGPKTIQALLRCYNASEIYTVQAMKKYLPHSLSSVCTILEPLQTTATIMDKMHHMYGTQSKICHFQEIKDYTGRVPFLKSTTDQLGLGSHVDGLPSLVDCLMGPCQKVEKQFMLQWLSVRPTNEARKAMQRLVSDISTRGLARMNVLNPMKTFGILSNGGICKDHSLLQSLLSQLKRQPVCENAFLVAREYTGQDLDFEAYKNQCQAMIDLLSIHMMIPDDTNYPHIPPSFLEANEVHLVKSCLKDAVIEAKSLLNTTLERYQDVTFSYVSPSNSLGWASTLKPQHEGARKVYERKQNKVYLWNTSEIQDKIDQYTDLCERWTNDQFKMAQALSKRLTHEYGSALRVFLHSGLLMKAVNSHLIHVFPKGWGYASVDASHTHIELKNTFPYWMTKESSTLNDVKLSPGESMVITAFNAYGKSAIIRSVLVSGVLAMGGLMVPASEATFPELKHIMIRLPGVDRPACNLSSFEAEVEDMVNMLEMADANTLIGLDETFRSTSPKESLYLSQSILEFLQKQKTYCMFATHQHDLVTQNFTQTNMTLNQDHQFVPGVSGHSGAFDICTKYGMNSKIMERAMTLHGDSREQIHLCEKPKELIAKLLTDITGTNPHKISRDQHIPPILVRSPALYVIEEAENKFYIGETENAIRRREQHEKNHRYGDCWIVVMDNKSQARQYETLLQRSCLQKGIVLTSITDAHHNVR